MISLLKSRTIEHFNELDARAGVEVLQKYGINPSSVGVHFSEADQRLNGPYQAWFENFNVRKIKGNGDVEFLQDM